MPKTETGGQRVSGNDGAPSSETPKHHAGTAGGSAAFAWAEVWSFNHSIWLRTDWREHFLRPHRFRRGPGCCFLHKHSHGPGYLR